MEGPVRLWLRAEERGSERRAIVAPADAERLVRAGFEVTVEDDPRRVFATDAYSAAGCAVAPPGSWAGADRDVYVLGLKELPAEPYPLVHRHVYFGHAYKGQEGSAELLRRFASGGGALLDLEYLVDDSGRRLAAFGYWAGYVGAALAVLHRRGRLRAPLQPTTRPDLDALLAEPAGDATTTALVVGALGRSGRGARDALAAAGVAATAWDVEETRTLDRAALLDHDMLVNCVLATRPTPPFLTPDDVTARRRLSLVSDVTCDIGSPTNVLPIYDRLTTWDEPARRLADDPPLDLIAIDNLPTLLPEEASVAFSEELTPVLLSLPDGAPWQRCLETFRSAVAAVG
jgi:saccharopine dehydrogenase (NAD+, L-lysine-forming)